MNMLHSIRLAAELAAPPDEVYRMYLDRELHAAITGGPVTIAAREDADFVAFDGAISGRILHLVPGKRIVQTWRSNVFRKSDADSILILTLLPRGAKHTLLDLQQLNVPQRDYAGICRGWELYYFIPWRSFLATKAREMRKRHKRRPRAASRA
jgi:activator of HSP90 ATPase